MTKRLGVDLFDDGLIVDLFAGGGGASQGIEAALGRPVDIGINHDPVALAVHKANHPATRHVEEDIWRAKPEALVRGRRVALLWASPDCTHFSTAKGGKPRKKKLRTLAWAVYRWAKATLPAVIFLENVKEFEGWGPLKADGTPDKRYVGKTFKCWIRRLERLGYHIEWRMLDASLYGAPTRRRRLFIVARRDGQPITWPEFTHGPGRLPVRTAAECIDWSLPCPSIFERKRELKPKTQWRIAQGVRRFVLDAAQPFIVKFRGDSQGAAIDEPLPTITAGPKVNPAGCAHALGLATPVLVEMNHSNAPRAVDEPLGTVTGQVNRFNLVVPHIVGVGGRAGQSDPTGADAPVGTITAKNDRALVAPHLVKVNHGKLEARGASVDAPLATVCASRRSDAVVASTLVQMGYGEREGQLARVPGLDAPLGTVVAQGQKHGLVSAFLAKHFGDRGQRPGSAMDEPVATITASDHNALAAAHLVKLRGQCHSSGLDEPVPTLTSGGTHVAEVCAFLLKYYGTARAGQSLEAPLHTLTAKHRLGLVTVEGVDYQIVDIGMRMLEPHELLRAQFGRFAADYDLSPARTKTAMVRLIGNSVCPEVAEALVRANATVATATVATATTRRVA